MRTFFEATAQRNLFRWAIACKTAITSPDSPLMALAFRAAVFQTNISEDGYD